MSRKFSFAVRVDSVSPSHVYVSIFSGMVSSELSHKDATRGKAYAGVFSTEEFKHFMYHVKPHLVHIPEGLRSDLIRFTGYGEQR